MLSSIALMVYAMLVAKPMTNTVSNRIISIKHQSMLFHVLVFFPQENCNDALREL